MKKKNVFYLLFAALLLLGTSTYAQKDSIRLHTIRQVPSAWNGTSKSPDSDGQTYRITSAEELAWIAEQSQSTDFAGKVIRITEDIDLGGLSETPPSWMPIGSEAVPFQGEIDGGCHVVYNLYILSSLYPKGAGLVAESGTSAVIHHLGIAQGQIMTDATNNVGSFVGVHRGMLHHCFNMTQIIAHNGDNVGGLAGMNYGRIEYAYNAGIITDGNNCIGGLVGYNMSSAVLSNCYNMGYCKGSDHVGALFGRNEAPESQIDRVVFDQQLTRMYATGDGTNDEILTDNTKYAIEKSSTFTSHSSPFYQSPETEWHYASGGYWSHPQLLCFKDHPASQLSVKAIWLDADNRPIERAEGVGTPKEGNSPRKSFKLGIMNDAGSGAGQWFSPSQDVIKIDDPSGSRGAEVFRPCGNQEVILTLTYGQFVKQIYTIVKGYEVFDAGIVEGEVLACWNQEDVKFLSNNNKGKEASGGKDDEQKSSTYSYQYMIIRDTVLSRAPLQTEPLDTFYMSQETYKNWCLPTDVPGNYVFRRYVKDYKCKTEWTLSKGKEGAERGYLFLYVREKFDPGELVEKPDTIYAVLPQTLTIASARDATGGGGQFQYTWVMVRNAWDAETQDWLSPEEDDVKNPLYMGGSPVSTASFDYAFTKPGRYTFTRMVSEMACEALPVESYRPHIVYVYETIDPGSIEAFERQLCTPICTDTIHETDSVRGGNGAYTYRWLCNGVEVPNSDTTSLLLAEFPMESNQTYVFTRQVKDNTGLMDWQTSAGEVRVRVYKEYDAGSVAAQDELLCSELTVPDELTMDIAEDRAANGEPGSEFVYCWLLYRGGADTVLLDTLRFNTAALHTSVSTSDYDLSVPATIFIKRGVKNLLCEAEWKTSENAAVWHFGRAESKTIYVTICARDLPFRYEYTFSDGRTQAFLFEEAGQTYTLTDQTTDGCPLDITLVSQVSPIPAVETQPVVSLCETAGSLKIAYTILEGSPDRFDLTFSPSALDLGFRDSIGAVLPSSGVIEIPIPAFLPLGQHSLEIVFYAAISSSEECKKSAPQTIRFSVDMDSFVHRKENEVVFVDNSGKHNEQGLTFTGYQWYRNGEQIEGATGQFYYEYNGLNGFYQVVMTGADGNEYRSCVYEYRPATPVEQVETERLRGRKIIRDGRLLLIAGEKMYNVFGQEER